MNVPTFYSEISSRCAKYRPGLANFNPQDGHIMH